MYEMQKSYSRKENWLEYRNRTSWFLRKSPLENKYLPKKRPPIPKKIADELLVSCKHRCCICGEWGVEIHHIDGNPSNNREDNLIPLCGHCAKLVHLSPPSSVRIQRITPSQLRLYKKNWIDKCDSKSPQIFDRIDQFEERLGELLGEIKESKQSKERE